MAIDSISKKVYNFIFTKACENLGVNEIQENVIYNQALSIGGYTIYVAEFEVEKNEDTASQEALELCSLIISLWINNDSNKSIPDAIDLTSKIQENIRNINKSLKNKENKLDFDLKSVDWNAIKIGLTEQNAGIVARMEIYVEFYDHIEFDIPSGPVIKQIQMETSTGKIKES